MPDAFRVITNGGITMSTPTLKKTTDEAKVREYIRKCILLKFPTLTAYAAKENVSLQYVSNVLAGSKPMPDWMYKRFKITHVRVVNEHWEVEIPAPAPAKKVEAKPAKPTKKSSAAEAAAA